MKFHKIKASYNTTLKSTINDNNTKKYHEQITLKVPLVFWHYKNI